MSIKVHAHTANSTPIRTALTQSLPYSINLHYRTQHRNKTRKAHILATFPPDAVSIPHCWAAAYLDQSMRPETELWIFASGEMPGHSPGDEFCAGCKTAVLALIDHMSTLPVPPMQPGNEPALELARQHEREHPESGPGVRYPVEAGAYMRHLLIPSVLSLGACHHQIVEILLEVGLVREEFPGHEAQLYKWLFKISDLPQTRELPDGLRWGRVREADIPIVQSRTAIPRSTKTLMSLESIGVFDNTTDEIAAWAFLGLDGSLTTLHTEPRYRGKGIAKAIAAKIFRDFAPGLAVDYAGTAWAHADVYTGNLQSEAVCRSLGGEPLWKHFWVRIDLGKGGRLATSQ
jgi:GNAT superfamily N-acetyltransferase